MGENSKFHHHWSELLVLSHRSSYDIHNRQIRVWAMTMTRLGSNEAPVSRFPRMKKANGRDQVSYSTSLCR